MPNHLQARYQHQLDDKVTRLSSLLAPYDAPTLSVFPSPPEHYRMRAEFRVWHEGTDLYYIMFDAGTREKYRVDQLPAAGTLINQLMPAVLDFIKDKPILRERVFQVDFLTSTTNEAVVSLLYHRQLDDEWMAAAQTLRAALSTYGTISIIGRARKQKLVLGSDAVTETLTVLDKTYRFEQVENSFTQPNAIINESMLSWVKQATADLSGDLLELYCGNGNFSLPLADNFDRVLATEISKTSVRSAEHNIQLNQIDNVTVVRLAAEEVTQAIQGERQFRRLQGIDLTTYDCRTVLVDPPRAGLDAETLKMISQYETIVYISCNPSTLSENLAQLCQSHTIVKAALFDQFPFTEHTEAGVMLQKKQG